eukprot:TRINITY_DN198_c1_g2_i6.p1 TRINITY_DN198_c1_g2~~TRINITY_DN198_c1_g2_i6.p1  ORF type:complete len:1714 (+),score=245.85 TRINITY_DN198_c1_g2_i6:372-5144(+)
MPPTGFPSKFPVSRTGFPTRFPTTFPTSAPTSEAEWCETAPGAVLTVSGLTAGWANGYYARSTAKEYNGRPTYWTPSGGRVLYYCVRSGTWLVGDGAMYGSVDNVDPQGSMADCSYGAEVSHFPTQPSANWSVLSNSRLVPQPNATTSCSGTCDVSNGTGPSSEYPCTCGNGTAVCIADQWCDAAAASCSNCTQIRVSGMGRAAVAASTTWVSLEVDGVYERDGCKQISGRDTYWHPSGNYYIFYCTAYSTWQFGSTTSWTEQDKDGSCWGVLQSRVGGDLVTSSAWHVWDGLAGWTPLELSNWGSVFSCVSTQYTAPPCPGPAGPCWETDRGSRCVFPFRYNGITFDNCTVHDWHRLWCATGVDGDGVQTTWGNCEQPCGQAEPSAPTRYPAAAPTASPTVSPSAPVGPPTLSPSGYTGGTPCGFSDKMPHTFFWQCHDLDYPCSPTFPTLGEALAACCAESRCNAVTGFEMPDRRWYEMRRRDYPVASSGEYEHSWQKLSSGQPVPTPAPPVPPSPPPPPPSPSPPPLTDFPVVPPTGYPHAPGGARRLCNGQVLEVVGSGACETICALGALDCSSLVGCSAPIDQFGLHQGQRYCELDITDNCGADTDACTGAYDLFRLVPASTDAPSAAPTAVRPPSAACRRCWSEGNRCHVPWWADPCFVAVGLADGQSHCTAGMEWCGDPPSVTVVLRACAADSSDAQAGDSLSITLNNGSREGGAEAHAALYVELGQEVTQVLQPHSDRPVSTLRLAIAARNASRGVDGVQLCGITVLASQGTYRWTQGPGVWLDDRAGCRADVTWTWGAGEYDLPDVSPGRDPACGAVQHFPTAGPVRGPSQLSLASCTRPTGFHVGLPTQDRPCGNVWGAALAGDKVLFPCREAGALLCTGDGSDPGTTVSCWGVGMLGCPSYVISASFTRDLTAVYVACAHSVSRCSWNAAGGLASYCLIVPNAVCPGGAETASATLSPDEQTLILGCNGYSVGLANSGLAFCPLNSPAGSGLSGPCTFLGEKPCSSSWHIGIQLERDNVAVACGDEVAYCDFSMTAGPSACQSMGTTPCTGSDSVGITLLGSGQTLIACRDQGLHLCGLRAPSASPSTGYPTGWPTGFPSTGYPTVQPTAAPSAPIVAGTCALSPVVEGSFVPGCHHGRLLCEWGATLQEALAKCCAHTACGGITERFGVFELRRRGLTVDSFNHAASERSWLVRKPEVGFEYCSRTSARDGWWQTAAGVPLESPCPSYTGGMAASGGASLFACGQDGAVVCDGDASIPSQRPVTCRLAGTLQCSTVLDVAFSSSPPALYAACQDRLVRCDWDPSAAVPAANCTRLLGASCGLGGQFHGIAAMRTDPSKLVVSCQPGSGSTAAASVRVCPLEAAGGSVLAAGCIERPGPPDGPCGAVVPTGSGALRDSRVRGGALDIGPTGRITVGCMSRYPAYCKVGGGGEISNCDNPSGALAPCDVVGFSEAGEPGDGRSIVGAGADRCAGRVAAVRRPRRGSADHRAHRAALAQRLLRPPRRQDDRREGVLLAGLGAGLHVLVLHLVAHRRRRRVPERDPPAGEVPVDCRGVALPELTRGGVARAQGRAQGEAARR